MKNLELIKKAKESLPESEEINGKFYVTPVLNNEPFPSVDVIRLVEFEKISDKGVLSWRFKSIT